MAERKILLVEDNPDDEELALRALRKGGILNEVVVAHDGVEALELLFGTESSQDSLLPTVVFLDLRLPRLNGLQVLRAIRSNARTRLLPVTILTSSNEERDIVEGYGLGANSYVRKPVDSQEFSRAITELGLYWLLLNEPTNTRR